MNWEGEEQEAMRTEAEVHLGAKKTGSRTEGGWVTGVSLVPSPVMAKVGGEGSVVHVSGKGM